MNQRRHFASFLTAFFLLQRCVCYVSVCLSVSVCVSASVCLSVSVCLSKKQKTNEIQKEKWLRSIQQDETIGFDYFPSVLFLVLFFLSFFFIQLLLSCPSIDYR